MTKKYLNKVALLIFLIAGTGLAQDGPPLAIFSYEETSCGAWVKSGEKEWARAQYLSWFRGFVSGYNYGNPNNQVPLERIPDQQTLSLFVDKYCRDNPLNPFVSAAFKLVEEVRINQAPKKPKGR